MDLSCTIRFRGTGVTRRLGCRLAIDLGGTIYAGPPQGKGSRITVVFEDGSYTARYSLSFRVLSRTIWSYSACLDFDVWKRLEFGYADAGDRKDLRCEI